MTQEISFRNGKSSKTSNNLDPETSEKHYKTSSAAALFLKTRMKQQALDVAALGHQITAYEKLTFESDS